MKQRTLASVLAIAMIVAGTSIGPVQAQSLPPGVSLPTENCRSNAYFYDGSALRDVTAPDRFNPLRYGGFVFQSTTNFGPNGWYNTTQAFDTSQIDVSAKTLLGDPFSTWTAWAITRLDLTPGSVLTIDLEDTDIFNDGAAWALFDSSGNQLARWPNATRLAAVPPQHYLTMDNQNSNPLEADTFEPAGNPNQFRISDDFPTEPFTAVVPADGIIYFHAVATDEGGQGRIGVQSSICNFADIAITKTNTPGVNGNVDQANDAVITGSTTTYTLTVTNNGPLSVTGPVVTDTPGTGITCPATNPVSISGSGVPAGSFTVSDLTGSGITLGTLADGQSTTLTFSCGVN